MKKNEKKFLVWLGIIAGIILLVYYLTFEFLQNKPEAFLIKFSDTLGENGLFIPFAFILLFGFSFLFLEFNFSGDKYHRDVAFTPLLVVITIYLDMWIAFEHVYSKLVCINTPVFSPQLTSYSWFWEFEIMIIAILLFIAVLTAKVAATSNVELPKKKMFLFGTIGSIIICGGMAVRIFLF